MGKVVYKDESGREHSVPVGPENRVVSIGRSTDCTIRSSRKSVSRRHAEIRYGDGVCRVVDLDSSNGTFLRIDGERHRIGESELLEHDDEVWCGDFILHYYEDESQSPVSPQSGPGAEEESSHDTVGFDDLEPEIIGDDDEDLYEHIERLEAEKESVEDLASRQAIEIEELEVALEEKEEQLEAARDTSGVDEGDVARLEGELREAEAEIEALETECDELARENEQLDEAWVAERERADRLERELEASGPADPEIVEELEAERDDLLRENDELRARIGELEDELADRRAEIAAIEGTQEELERDLAETEDELESAREKIESLSEERSELRERADALEEERDRVRAQVEETTEAPDPVDSDVDELETEIQGLRQRLSSERDQRRELEERAEELEAENRRLRGQQRTGREVEGGEGEGSGSEIRQGLEELQRVVDALDRADLDSLPTVDRIRLQSALRDASPHEQLDDLLEWVESSEESRAE